MSGGGQYEMSVESTNPLKFSRAFRINSHPDRLKSLQNNLIA